jgi:hypothetical protein
MKHSMQAYKRDQKMYPGELQGKITVAALRVPSRSMTHQCAFLCGNGIIDIMARKVLSGEIVTRFGIDQEAIFLLWFEETDFHNFRVQACMQELMQMETYR